MESTEPKSIHITKIMKVKTHDGKLEDYKEVISCNEGNTECNVEITQNEKITKKSFPKSQMFPNKEAK